MKLPTRIYVTYDGDNRYYAEVEPALRERRPELFERDTPPLYVTPWHPTESAAYDDADNSATVNGYPVCPRY